MCRAGFISLGSLGQLAAHSSLDQLRQLQFWACMFALVFGISLVGTRGELWGVCEIPSLLRTFALQSVCDAALGILTFRGLHPVMWWASLGPVSRLLRLH